MKVTRLPLVGFDPVQFFLKIGAGEASPAYMQSGKWTVIAWDPAESMAGRDMSVLTRVKALQRRNRTYAVKDLPFLGGSIGWISYDAGLRHAGIKSRHRKQHPVPDVCFHRYPQALLWNGSQVFAVGDAGFRKKAHEIHRRPIPPVSIRHPDWTPAVSRTEYAAGFKRIMTRIKNGDIYQMNYTYPFTASFSADPRILFCQILTTHPAASASYLEYGRSALLSFSPERFVQIRRGRITTCPIKGTRPRGTTAREDEANKKQLLRDPKETAELNMITDLLRNDVGQVSVAGSVRVKGHRLVTHTPSVWHTYSVVEGKILPRLHPLDAMVSMFPGGSVTGCPKVAAMEDIDRIEAQHRGLYCGSVVMQSDDGTLESSIVIRSIERSGPSLKLGVGGGIVADSRCEQEEDETLRKASRLLSLPGGRTWVNGKETDDHQLLALLRPDNPDASGAFETMVADGGVVRQRGAHLKRLAVSARALNMSLTPARLRVISRWLDLAAGATDGLARVKLVVSGRDVIIEVRPLIRNSAVALGATVTVTPLVRHVPEAKALPYHREWRAYADAVAQGAHETLLLQPDGTVSEGAVSNLFYVKQGVLYTPATGMLRGITRSRVIALARKEGIPVKYKAPSLPELLSADEVFLTRATEGVIPVTNIRHTRVKRGTPGRISRLLLRRLQPR